MKVIFFGSFLHYSALILEALLAADELEIVAVVTTPPSPAGRNQELKKTEVHVLAEQRAVSVFAPEKLDESSLSQLDQLVGRDDQLVFLTAGYGKLLTQSWLGYPQLGALNLHFSLLPAYRGANPAEWALLMGETKTGVTLIEMSPEFDTGKIVAQATSSIEKNDTRETVYEKLYTLGGQVLPDMLRRYAEGTLVPTDQSVTSPTPYAKRLTREDGYIAWGAWQDAVAGRPVAVHYLSQQLQTIAHHLYEPLDYLPLAFLERAVRALVGFPGVWTIVPTVKGDKRMKILAVTVTGQQLTFDRVHIEGQQIAQWNQVKNSIIFE